MERYIIQKIEHIHVIWFANSNQWIQTDEPQWFIFLLYRKQVLREEAVQAFGVEYGHDEAAAIVNNLYDSLEVLDGEWFPSPDYSLGAEEAAGVVLPPQRLHHYRLGQKYFSVHYGNDALEQYIHLPLKHLEITTPSTEGLRMEVYGFGERYALRLNGSKCLTTDESPQIKQLIFAELSYFLYDIAADGWMARLHASAVEKNGRLLLLSSPGGSGKSTMAALLLKHGYHFFADDFIPVSIQNELLYPFPPAICIKKGSLPVLAREGIVPDLLHGHTGYISPDRPPHEILPLKAQDIVFIRYRPGLKAELKPLSVAEALPLFMNEGWVSNHYEGAKQFISWFSRLKFYTLEYGDNKAGIGVLDEIV